MPASAETFEPEPDNSPTVRTSSLFGYLFTVLAWELEIGVLAIHAFTEKQLDPVGHLALVAISALLTAFAWATGKRDFRNLRHTGGRVSVSPFQALLVTVFMIGFGGLLGLIVMRLVNH